MTLYLTGTGPATGFPVPGCPCAACSVAGRAHRPDGALIPRRPAELTIDGRWRLDAANGVRDGDGPARFPADGEHLDLGSGTVLGLGPAGLLVRLEGRDPLLWAPRSGLLSDETVERLAGLELGTVVLGPEPDPDAAAPDHVPSSLDCGLTLARLRATGTVTPRTRAVLVGLGHRQGPADRTAVRLAHWGAVAPGDGEPLEPAGPATEPARRTLVLGGASSGKSGLAEELVWAEPEVLYAATGPGLSEDDDPDGEWAHRLRRHRERRPAWWGTAETLEVAPLLASTPGPVLLDSVGTWLTGVLDQVGAWTGKDGWRDRLEEETDALLRAWRARTGPLVAVSDEAGLGVVPASESGRVFRDELGSLNRKLADESEEVLLVVAGRLVVSPGLAG